MFINPVAAISCLWPCSPKHFLNPPTVWGLRWCNFGRASGCGVDATMVGGGFVGFPVGAERFGGLCTEVVVFSPSGMRSDWFGGSRWMPSPVWVEGSVQDSGSREWECPHE